MRVYRATLAVLSPSSPEFQLATHAPVLYGRSVSASGDTPLITYGRQSPGAGGTSVLQYVITWSHEDSGTGLVPVDEWGTWGRMTDIETVLNERVGADGHILSAEYFSCGCESVPNYPDSAPDLPPNGETDQPFAGSYAGLHAVLRDATGNNDVSDAGTSAFRFQQALVPPPPVGATREAADDAHPWVYRVSNEEVRREYPGQYSTDPRSVGPGDYRQYLIADLDMAASGTDSVALEVRLNGGSTWYSNDYEQTTGGVPSTYPFYNGGHGRTVVKLPMDWLTRGIAAARLRYDVPPGGSAHVVVRRVRLLALTPDWRLVAPPVHWLAPVAATAVVPRPIG